MSIDDWSPSWSPIPGGREPCALAGGDGVLYSVASIRDLCTLAGGVARTDSNAVDSGKEYSDQKDVVLGGQGSTQQNYGGDSFLIQSS